jgi:hypothetical protein
MFEAGTNPIVVSMTAGLVVTHLQVTLRSGFPLTLNTWIHDSGVREVINALI